MKKINTLACVFAIAFALFEIIGFSFAEMNNWSLAITTYNGGIYFSVLMFIGYTVLFYFGILLFQKYVEKENCITGMGFFRFGTEHPFIVSFVILHIAYIPYILAFYPSIFMGDAFYYICTYIEEATDYYMLAHVPAGYTFMIFLFVKAGILIFNSSNAGIFLYSIFQFLMVISSVSYANMVCVKVRKKWTIINWFVLLFFIVTPLVQDYMFVLTKDVLYVAYLLFIFSHSFRLINAEKIKVFDFVFTAILIVGMFMQRKDAPYLLIFSFALIAVLCKRLRKYSIYIIVCAFVFQLIMKMLILPGFGFEDGRAKEMLHIPIQQTVRCIVYHESEFTEEERGVLREAFDDYDTLAEGYNPVQADGSKNHFVADLDSKLLAKYLWTWLKMFFRFPGTYLQATINNYYEYFYFGDKPFRLYRVGHSEDCMSNVSRTEYVSSEGINFNYPEKLQTLRENYDSAIFYATEIPVFRILSIPAFYVWGFLLLIYCSLKKKRKDVLALLSIPLGTLLIALTTATNATYSRYEYPLVMLFPFILCFSVAMLRKNEE